MEEGHEGARGNLEVEVRGIENRVLEYDDKSNGTEEELVDGFLRLHAVCYRGVGGDEHEKLEQRIIERMAEGIRRGLLSQEKASKMVLCNIAAEYDAGVRLRGKVQFHPLPRKYDGFQSSTGELLRSNS